jgi:hypothetical protein
MSLQLPRFPRHAGMMTRLLRRDRLTPAPIGGSPRIGAHSIIYRCYVNTNAVDQAVGTATNHVRTMRAVAASQGAP